ncbi:MAG: GMC family oxidoreductase N-terminal domain-containing protein [Actinomycetota bacterium]
MIVVGAGPAGCAATARLLDEGASVVLVDAGPGPPYPPAVSSLDALAAVAAPGRIRGDVLLRRSDPVSAGAPVPYEVGRGIGGGAAVNAMVLTTGDTTDYDRWATATGDRRWAWSSLAPGHDELVRRLRPTVMTPGPLGAAVATAAGLGSIGRSSAEPGARGVLLAATSSDAAGRRPLLPTLLGVEPGGPLHPRLRVVADRRVRAISLDGARRGVETDGGRIDADRVVVAAGTLASPRLLAGAGLAQPVASVDHGEVRDHPSFSFTVALRSASRRPERPVPPVSVVVMDDLGDSSTPVEVIVHVLDHVGAGDGRRFGAVIVALAAPTSLGRFTARPDGGVSVDPGWLRSDDDAARMATAVRVVGRWLAEPAVEAVAEAVHIDDRGTPLATLDAWSDDELVAWLRANPGPVRHAVSSLGGMTPTVTDGIVVVDGSVLPGLPPVNPQLPIMTAAWRFGGG